MNDRDRRGFILLLTVLVISIFLAIGLSVFAIGMKELKIASFIKESRRAFAVADRAIECALYWDRAFPANGIPYTIFPTSTTYIIPNLTNARCDGDALANGAASWPTDDTAPFGVPSLHTIPASPPADPYPTYEVRFSLQFQDGMCADVLVTKHDLDTTIRADGFNTCTVTDPRRIQRTIEVTNNI
jgi:hypothetical protein